MKDFRNTAGGGDAGSALDLVGADAQALLSSILTLTTGAVISIDQDQRITFFNRGAERIFGYLAGEAFGQPIEMLLPPEHRAAHAGHIASFAKSDTASRLMGERSSISGCRKNGEVFPAEASISKVEVDGQVILTVVLRDITAQMEAETALRESEDRLELAVKASNVGLWDRNIETNEDYFSPRWKEILGYGEYELEPHVDTFFELLHPDDRHRAGQAVQAHLEDRVPYDLEFRLRHRNGSYMWVHAVGQAVWDDTGKPIRMAGSIADIGGRKQAEQALIDSEASLEQAQSIAQLGSWVWDAASARLTCSKGLLSLLQLNEADGMNAPAIFRSMVHPDDRDKILHYVDIPSHGDSSQSGDYRITLGDGIERIFRTLWQVEREKNGAVARIYGVTQDVTETRQAEGALRDSEVSLVEAQRIAKLGSWDWNVETGENVWSDEIYRIFGLIPQQFAASYEAFLDYVHPDDKQSVIDAVDRALNQNEPYSIDHRILLPDGQEKVVHEQGHVIFDQDGRPLRMIGTVQDVTENRYTEALLRQAQKMEVVGQLTGGVAHDFNNLLAVVVGNLEMVADELRSDAPEFEFVRNAFNAAERGASLTHHLLAFSRQQVLQPKEVDIRQLIADTRDLMAVSMGEKITMGVQATSNLWRCEVDQVQLQNAILNLSINARDAMPSGGTVSISAENTTLDAERAEELDVIPGAYVCLSVNDNGPGIPEDVLEHVYEPFFTTKDVGEGSGLGLSMVYGFAQQSGGAVNIKTAEGEGTTVRLFFPAVQADVEANADTENEEGAVVQSEPDATILLVEDNASFRDITTKILHSLNFEVTAFRTAEESLEVIGGTAKFDLLLSDIGLPGDMNGHDLAEFAASARPGLKIVLMSAHTDPAVIGGVIDDNVSAFIRKPHRKAQLNKVLRQVLDLESDRHASASSNDIIPFPGIGSGMSA